MMRRRVTGKRKRRAQLRSEPIDYSQARFRSFALDTGSIDEATRSIGGVLLTETPVVEMDYQTGQPVPHVVLMSGVTFRAAQLPLLDVHRRDSNDDHLGSIRELRIDGDRVVCRAYYSATAEKEWTKVREGHLTDLSAGRLDLSIERLRRGERRTIAGRAFVGPLNVVTRCFVFEGSATPAGADQLAKMRSEPPSTSTPTQGIFAVNPQLRALLVGLGMPEALTDDEAQTWAIEHKSRVFAATPPASPPAGDLVEQLRALLGVGATAPPAAPIAITPETIGAAIDQALEAREQRRTAFRGEVDSLFALAAVEPTEQLRSQCYAQPDLVQVRQLITDFRAQQQEQVPGAHIRFADRQPFDRGLAAIGTAINLRCLATAANIEPGGVAQIGTEQRRSIVDAVFPVDQRSKDAGDYEHATLLDMARDILHWGGVQVRGLSNEQIAMVAWGFADQVYAPQLRSGAALHVTGSLPNLTRDAVNKSMQVGYALFPSTWQMVFRRGQSVADFKRIHRIRLGGIPNVPVWNDQTLPNLVKLRDVEEAYAVEAYSEGIDFSYQLIVNNDMDGISRLPAQLGNACSRTVNASAWSVITANPTMADGQALFLASPTGNRFRSNLTTGAISDYSAALQTMRSKMRLMRGENQVVNGTEIEGQDVLNIQPRYLIGPAALEQTLLQQVRSAADPNASHAGVANVNTSLMPVIEPLLDASSSTTIYLACDPAQCDTVEVTFLQGQERPQVRMVENRDMLSQRLYVLQCFAAAPLNHRGLQKHAGA